MTPWLFLILCLSVIGVVSLILYWLNKPLPKMLSTELRIETKVVSTKGAHNAFTDLTFWNGSFYLVYISSPSHFANRNSQLVILKSDDFKTWKEAKRLSHPGKDIRDPKITSIDNNLILYALLNDSFNPQPVTTVYSKSKNGSDWSDFQELNKKGWLFGRPKTKNDGIWFASAHNSSFTKSALFQSTNGMDWSFISEIVDQPGQDETSLDFVGEDIYVVSRFEPDNNWLGSRLNGTCVYKSTNPYTKWDLLETDHRFKIDSPNLFTVDQKLFGIGRYQPEVDRFLCRLGSIFSTKRTAVYQIDEGKINFIASFPSCGDTSYAGVVTQGGRLYVSYYSSRLKNDIPWIIGMLSPTDIYTAEGDVSELTQTQIDRSRK